MARATPPPPLPSLEDAIVELLSVFHEDTTRTDLTRALGQLGHRPSGRAPTAAEILPILDTMTARGLLEGAAHWRVPADIAHAATQRAAREERLDAIARVVRSLRPVPMKSGAPAYTSWQQAVRELRIEIYAARWEQALALYAGPARNAFAVIPFDAAWFSSFPVELRLGALMDVISAALANLLPCDQALAMLEREPELTDGAHHLLVEQMVLRGRVAEAERLLASSSSIQSRVGRAWLLALRGEWEASIATFERALVAYLEHCGKRARFFPDWAGTFFVIALLAHGRSPSLERAKALSVIAMQKGISGYPRAYEAFGEIADVFAGTREALDRFGLDTDERSLHPLTLLPMACARVWDDGPVGPALAAALRDRASRARAAGLGWLASQFAGVLLRGKARDPDGELAALRAELDTVCLADAVRRPERWAGALEALAAIASEDHQPAAGPARRSERLVWIMRQGTEWIDLEAREQTLKKNVWSKGRPVALKRLYEEAGTRASLTAADRLACAAIEEHVSFTYGRYRDVSYQIDAPRALRALVGQPNVLTEVGGALVPVEIRERPVRLRVEAKPTGFCVVLDPAPRGEEQQVEVVRAGPATIEIVPFTREHHAIARALGKNGLEVPSAGEPKLREVLVGLSRVVAIEADLEAGELAPADPTPVFILRALGEGLSVELAVRPLGARGPRVSPGEGGASFFGDVEGRRARVLRDPREELRRADEVLARCPTLASAERTSTGWTIPDRSRALETLDELRGATMEWPDGAALRVSEPLSVAHLAVRLRAAQGGFEADGTLHVGSDALSIATLLEYLDASPGRFLRMRADGEFLALTADLRRRLEELRALSSRNGDKLRIHRLLVPRVDLLLDGANVRADASWKKQRARLAPGDDPELPSTLRAELRSYQIDGFRWLARLGRWGAGGCLADEMGLGKTVQTIALLVLRAPDGPSLVVAPTSVVPNWCDEIARFAPTLRARLYAGEGRTIGPLGPFDVLVTSYALLSQDADELARVRFAVAVLDEAQAIKNARTQRAQAALRLTADQRIATTGTPIENSVDDLLSLFSFLVPGLLSSDDATDLERLKTLVSPFLLRRTRTSVLPELPSRTEVTLRVEMCFEEMGVYEAVREEALAAIERARQPGKRRMHIFAALTALRRAASNARLVLADERRPSAKLDALGELLDELLPGRHKLLVFSQFVDHLAIVRELLDERGVSYQYLDGATPLAKRKAAIDAFQEGRSEVFLISLKAGGLGLNLTAADYVVHMDPWWNPAVEDQAASRAHRIGQTRPVTIYRIVARNTIEERIVELHHRKRDLAASLLEGTDLAARISEEELLELIRGS
jgi:superfamily II DNA or RNA helicase